MGVHKATLFPNDSRTPWSLRASRRWFYCLCSRSLLVGDSAIGETEAVQMSPPVPTAPTCIPYSKLEQSNQRRGKNTA